ncbi:MAG: glycosyltransferase family 2 protein [Alphaproteobacteria bacterium]
MPQRPELSVIVPIYNEEGLLWESAESLAGELDRLVGARNWQFVLIDNGSADESPTIVKRIAARWPGAVTLRLPKPNYGAALRAGLEAATGVWVYLINVDFWDAAFLAWSWQNRQDYDLILGSKRADPTINGQTRYRRVLSWGLNAAFALIFEFVGMDTHGIKFCNLGRLRPILQRCVMKRGQYDSEFTLRALRAGLRVAEVPVPYADKRKNRNLMIKKIAWNLMDLFRLRQVVQAVPWTGPLNYHRWSRADVEAAAGGAEVASRIVTIKAGPGD